MKIQIFQLLGGARRAKGLTVIIDVFRAFSVATYAFGNGAARIFPVDSLAQAHALKNQNPDWRLIGERRGERPQDFDFGNSPSEVENVDFCGQTLVQTTSAGTRGLVNAVGADEIFIGAFVNAPAMIRAIQARAPRQVSLVCMRDASLSPALEDTLCAEFIRAALTGQNPDFQAMHVQLRESLHAQRFLNAEKATAPHRDFDLCLDLGRFGFVLRAVRDD